MHDLNRSKRLVTEANVPPIDKAFVDYQVGWFLNDPIVWRHLHKLWDPILNRRLPPRVCRAVGPDYRVKLPSQPYNLGLMYKKIFLTVAKNFRSRLQIHNKLDGKDAQATSFSLSYIALLDCVRSGHADCFSYVFKSCCNTHLKHLKPLNRLESLCSDEDVQGDCTLKSDLSIDFEQALRKLAQSEARICQYHLVENLNFAEIARLLPDRPDRCTVMRRFKRGLKELQCSLKDYAEVDFGFAST